MDIYLLKSNFIIKVNKSEKYDTDIFSTTDESLGAVVYTGSSVRDTIYNYSEIMKKNNFNEYKSKTFLLPLSYVIDKIGIDLV